MPFRFSLTSGGIVHEKRGSETDIIRKREKKEPTENVERGDVRNYDDNENSDRSINN